MFWCGLTTQTESPEGPERPVGLEALSGPTGMTGFWRGRGGRACFSGPIQGRRVHRISVLMFGCGRNLLCLKGHLVRYGALDCLYDKTLWQLSQLRAALCLAVLRLPLAESL